MSRTYRNMAQALKDPASNASRMMARFDAVRARNDEIIAAWMAQGLTREQAYTRALQRVAS